MSFADDEGYDQYDGEDEFARPRLYERLIRELKSLRHSGTDGLAIDKLIEAVTMLLEEAE